MKLTVDVHHSFPGLNLSISFENAQNLGVLFGYSGAWKSVTLQIIAGLFTPEKGRVQLGDRLLFDSEAKINLPPGRRRIGYVFQENMLFPHMDVRQNILFGGRAMEPAVREAKMRDMALQFRIDRILDHMPSSISGGQKKRVALAMALMSNPDLLLLDEPFSALDAPLRTRMRECLSGVMKHLDIPVLLVTHDIFEALHVGDSMHLISKGRVLQSGIPSEMLRSPCCEEAAALLEIPALPSLDLLPKPPSSLLK